MRLWTTKSWQSKNRFLFFLKVASNKNVGFFFSSVGIRFTTICDCCPTFVCCREAWGLLWSSCWILRTWHLWFISVLTGNLSFDPAAEFMNAKCGCKLLAAGCARADTTPVFVCLKGSRDYKCDNLGHMESVEELFKQFFFVCFKFVFFFVVHLSQSAFLWSVFTPVS